MIKLIAIDLDGTLLNSDKQIPEGNKTAIAEAIEAGISVVICTGRPLSGVKALVEELGMEGKEEFVILNNGCSIHETKDWGLVDYESLTLDEVCQLKTYSENFDGVYLTLTSTGGYEVYEDEVPELIAMDAAIVSAEPIMVTPESIEANDEIIFQAMFMGEQPVLDQFQEKYHDELVKDFSITRSQAYIYEAMPYGATKASALEKLANKLGASREEVMALGDADNDLQMLEYAGHSVAMGNATDHIKSICRHHTGTNNDAGVGQAIREIALPSRQG